MKLTGRFLGADAHAAPADGGGHGGDGLVLADDPLFQAALQLLQLLILLGLDLAGGDLGPKLDDPGQVSPGSAPASAPRCSSAISVQLQTRLRSLAHALIVASSARSGRAYSAPGSGRRAPCSARARRLMLLLRRFRSEQASSSRSMALSGRKRSVIYRSERTTACRAISGGITTPWYCS